MVRVKTVQKRCEEWKALTGEKTILMEENIENYQFSCRIVLCG